MKLTGSADGSWVWETRGEVTVNPRLRESNDPCMHKLVHDKYQIFDCDGTYPSWRCCQSTEIGQHLCQSCPHGKPYLISIYIGDGSPVIAFLLEVVTGFHTHYSLLSSFSRSASIKGGSRKQCGPRWLQKWLFLAWKQTVDGFLWSEFLPINGGPGYWALCHLHLGLNPWNLVGNH